MPAIAVAASLTPDRADLLEVRAHEVPAGAVP
jgi:hypothetical protein